MPKCFRASIEIAQSLLKEGFIQTPTDKVTVQALQDSGSDIDILRESLAINQGVQIQKLEKPIRLTSIEKEDALIIENFAVTKFGIGNKVFTEKFAICELPPGPDVILGKPWLNTRCPEAMELLKSYGGDEGTEKPLAFGPCNDPKTAFSAGGDLQPHFARICAAIEAEEERRKGLGDMLIRHALVFAAKATINQAAKQRNIPLDEDEGYFSEEEKPVPEPPIRGLKFNPPGWPEMIPAHFHEYLDLFEDVTPDTKPVSIPGYDCEIRLRDGATLTSSKAYSMTQEELRALDKILAHELSLGIIRRSTAAAGVPVFFVRDPASEGRNDGMRQLRLVKDYRPLNKNIPDVAYPLPLTRQMIQKLSRAKLLRSFDAKSGYDLVPVTEESIPLTAFVTQRGLFESLRMPQGLKTAPAIFQRRLDHILHHLIGREGCGIYVYIDDIFVYADTQEDLDKVTRELFDALRKGGLKLSPKKAVWDACEIKCLGFTIVRGQGVKMSHDKVVLIKESRPPRNVADVRHLMGVINFYAHFIPHFADKAACITDLTKADEPWDWSEERRRAWEALCRWVREDIWLQGFDPEKPITLFTDASDVAFGGVIMQPSDMRPGELALIYCFHHKFREGEKGWGGPDKELFAIVHAFREFRDIFGAATHPITVRTDHRNLAMFMFKGDLAGHDGRRGRWWLELVDFNFIIEPVKGSENELADFMSRYGYPGSVGLEAKALLPMERFNKKALTDIKDWFRAEGPNIRQILEQGFASGRKLDKKEQKKMELAATKIEKKASEISDYLANLPDGEKLNDSVSTETPLAGATTRMAAPARRKFREQYSGAWPESEGNRVWEHSGLRLAGDLRGLGSQAVYDEMEWE
jgi:hypothetical protein